jgi:hypothetical protein
MQFFLCVGYFLHPLYVHIVMHAALLSEIRRSDVTDICQSHIIYR